MEWDYYDALVARDIEDKNKKTIDALEYLALFINPDGLKKVREMRERESNTSTNNQEITDGSVIVSHLDDDAFAKFIAENSEDGRVPVFAGKYVSN
jgi:hypothetical protein